MFADLCNVFTSASETNSKTHTDPQLLVLIEPTDFRMLCNCVCNYWLTLQERRTSAVASS
jgi:hypothetical protein